MKEYWENKFNQIGDTWGVQPSDTAIITRNLFLLEQKKNVLIPGVGYGRNARIFLESGIKVTGIEISEKAIKLAGQYGFDFKIHSGSVNQMPFDNIKYDGIYCYSLIHLLNKAERKKLIINCYNQLADEGLMVFVVVSTKSEIYGNGRRLSTNRFQVEKGLTIYFYDKESAKNEFKDYGLVKIQEMDEPVKHMDNKPPLKFLMITCRKITT